MHIKLLKPIYPCTECLCVLRVHLYTMNVARPLVSELFPWWNGGIFYLNVPRCGFCHVLHISCSSFLIYMYFCVIWSPPVLWEGLCWGVMFLGDYWWSERQSILWKNRYWPRSRQHIQREDKRDPESIKGLSSAYILPKFLYVISLNALGFLCSTFLSKATNIVHIIAFSTNLRKNWLILIIWSSRTSYEKLDKVTSMGHFRVYHALQPDRNAIL